MYAFDVVRYDSDRSEPAWWPGAEAFYLTTAGGEVLTTGDLVPLLSQWPTYVHGDTFRAAVAGVFVAGRRRLTLGVGDYLVASHPDGSVEPMEFAEVRWSVVLGPYGRVPIFEYFEPAEVPFATTGA